MSQKDAATELCHRGGPKYWLLKLCRGFEHASNSKVMEGLRVYFFSFLFFAHIKMTDFFLTQAGPADLPQGNLAYSSDSSRGTLVAKSLPNDTKGIQTDCVCDIL